MVPAAWQIHLVADAGNDAAVDETCGGKREEMVHRGCTLSDLLHQPASLRGYGTFCHRSCGLLASEKRKRNS
jgi:hypothetical protein